MPGNLKDLTGNRYGRLRVVSHAGRIGARHKWVCQCDCGNSRTVAGVNLQSGATKSCGCLNKDNQQSRKNKAAYLRREQSVWRNMMDRCNNPTNKGYATYGGRGITVCKRWWKFENFFADMGRIPKGHTLERRNNDKGYSPSNCVWATKDAQARNRSDNVWLTANGKRMVQSDWAALLGTTPAVIAHRLRNGWTEQDACTKPVRVQKRRQLNVQNCTNSDTIPHTN